VGLNVYVFQSWFRKCVTFIWNGSVCVVPRLCGRQMRNHGPIPNWGKRFVTQSDTHCAVVAFSPAIKWPVCEAHHPHPSSAELKNDRSYISTATNTSQSMHRDFTYFVGCALHCSIMIRMVQLSKYCFLFLNSNTVTPSFKFSCQVQIMMRF
jgi:hypothetical protein